MASASCITSSLEHTGWCLCNSSDHHLLKQRANPNWACARVASRQSHSTPIRSPVRHEPPRAECATTATAGCERRFSTSASAIESWSSFQGGTKHPSEYSPTTLRRHASATHRAAVGGRTPRRRRRTSSGSGGMNYCLTVGLASESVRHRSNARRAISTNCSSTFRSRIPSDWILLLENRAKMALGPWDYRRNFT